MAPLLAIERLRVDFPEIVAVHDLSLALEPGDLCGLIGPDGAGKSTTLRAAAGLQECTHGSVKVDGCDLAREPEERKRRLGFLPDFSPLYDHLTPVEFLDHFARAHALPDRGRRIEDCLEWTGLTARRDDLCERLSRGLRLRLLLAKTLLPDPQVLLLDEPASGLDPLGRIELWKLLLQLREAGKAMLVSSPVLGELARFGNKAAIMDRGRLLAFGDADALARQLDHRRISVKWCANESRALEILKNARGVHHLVADGQGAVFDFESGADALHELLRVLINQNVHVTEWRSADDELEQIFQPTGAAASR
jgi:ABC-2 type transport system ATP-binding protein